MNKKRGFGEIKEFLSMIENQTKLTVRRIRSDRGGEYMSTDTSKYLKESGIIHEPTGGCQPQQNGVAERINRTLSEEARCMISYHSLSRKFWAEAIQTANLLRNDMPTKILGDQSPHEKWSGHKPDVSYLRVFGSKAFVFIPKDNRKKWDPKSRLCTFVGYKGRSYRFMDDRTQRLVVSANAKFIEASKNSSVECKTEIEDISPTESKQSNNISENLQNFETYGGAQQGHERVPRRSGRVRKQPTWLTYEHEDSDEDTAAGAVMMLANETDPQTVEEALSSSEKDFWKEAMEKEINSLLQNNTWKLVLRYAGMRTLTPSGVLKSNRKR